MTLNHRDRWALDEIEKGLRRGRSEVGARPIEQGRQFSHVNR
jgi:hypothetical protein